MRRASICLSVALCCCATMGVFAGCESAERASTEPAAIVGVLLDGAPLPEGGLPRDTSSTSDGQDVRDAVVWTHSPARADVGLLAGVCGGILITPRVVVRAAHCGPCDQVAFGQPFTSFASTPVTAPGQAGALGCIAHPHALDLGAVTPPTCEDMGLFPGDTTSLDWELVVLDRRVDARRFGTSLHAVPAGVVRDSTMAPALGDPVRWANVAHRLLRPDAGVVGLDAGVVARLDPSRGRVLADLTYDGAFDEPAGPFAGRGAYTHFQDDGSLFISVGGGDSGSPFYVGDPDTSISLVTVTTEGRDYVDAGALVAFNPNVLGSRPAWDGAVGALLDQALCPGSPSECYLETDAYVRHRWYVGLADHDATHDPTANADDLDGDGLRDQDHDDCPGVYDPDQADRDGDGVGDACDNCAPEATGDAADFFNPGQLNCNIDAELAALRCDPRSADCTGVAASARALGDACDPIPCAWSHVELDARGDTLVPATIRLDPTVHGPLVRADTGFRYCRCAAAGVADGDTVAIRNACRAAGCLIPSRATEAASQYDPPESGRPAWRYVTAPRTDSATTAVTYVPAATGPHGLRAALPPPTYDWQLWDSDIPRWATLYAGEPAPSDTEQVPGVLWTHSPRDLGASTDPPTRALRSHFLSGPLGQVRVSIPSGPSCPPSGPLPPGCLALPVPDCRPGLPSIGPLCPPNGQWPWLTMPSSFAGLPPPILALQYGNTGALPAASLFPSAPPFTATDLAWVALSEPVALLRPDQSARFAAVSLDGARIATVLHDRPFGFAPLGFDPGCDPSSDPSKCFPSIAVVGDPLFVLSASRSELFVIDGEVSAVDLEDGARRSLRLRDLTLGGLLAASYDAIRDRVYVLDEVSAGHREHGRGRGASTVRLVSIDASGARGARVLGSWTRMTRNDRFALGSASDGNLYLAVSAGERRHIVARIVIEDPHGRGAHGRDEVCDEVHVHRIGAGAGAVGTPMLYAGPFDVALAVDTSAGIEVRHYPLSGPDHPADASGECF